MLSMHGVNPDDCQLSQVITAGLACLKTTQCHPGGKSPVLDCPACWGPLQPLAGVLPFSHHEQSRLVCRLSGQLMDDANPPLILPNGQVYSQAALQQHQLDGWVHCPVTGDDYPLSDARKLFIS